MSLSQLKAVLRRPSSLCCLGADCQNNINNENRNDLPWPVAASFEMKLRSGENNNHLGDEQTSLVSIIFCLEKMIGKQMYLQKYLRLICLQHACTHNAATSRRKSRFLADMITPSLSISFDESDTCEGVNCRC